MKKSKILFFTPSGGRTGSEMMLWYLLNALNPDVFEVQLVCFKDGELLKDFPPHIKTHYVPTEFSLSDKIKFKFGINRFNKRISEIQKQFKADIWYLNTIKTCNVFHLAKTFRVKTICHFHELPSVWNDLTIQELQNCLSADMSIGCSQIVYEKLCQVGAKNPVYFTSFSDLSQVKINQTRIQELKSELLIKETDFTWIMAGTPDYRKGYDFIPQIAEKLNNETVHLIWIGKPIDSGISLLVSKQIQFSNTKTRVHLLGLQKEDYFNYMALADGFMLTSREEPRGLVVIEAAFLQKPIVSFDSGGIAEFLQNGMGKVSETWTIGDYVQNMNEIMENKISFDPIKSKKRALEFDVLNQIQNWEKIILEFSKIQI
jgi:L-malate glycosyltransferase